MNRRVLLIVLVSTLCLILLWMVAGWAAASPAAEVERLSAGETAEFDINLPDGRLPLDAPSQSFSMTLPCAADTYLNQASPGTNYGWSESLSTGEHASTGTKTYTLVRFDLSALPAGSQVVSGTLRMAPLSTTETGSFYVVPEAILDSWTEYGTTWDTRPAATPMGDPAIQFNRLFVNEINVTNILLGWKLGWYGDHGIQLRADTGSTGYRYFLSRTTAEPPELVVYYTMKQTFTPSQDSWINQANEYVNYGSTTELRVNRTSLGDEGWAMIGFDLSGLPDDIAVSNAMLRVYSEINRSTDSAATLAGELMVDAIMGDWDEATVNWHNAPPSQAMGDPAATYVGYNQWTSLDVTEIVQGWTTGPLEPHGILVRVAPTLPSGNYLYPFRSRSTAHPPQLIIEYSKAVPVCHPITGVTVDGATEGVTDLAYYFTVNLTPADADPVDLITWEATDIPLPEHGEWVYFEWAGPGAKQITVTVEHCGGTTVGYHTATIAKPPLACAELITNFSLDGPTLLGTGQEAEFLGTASPSDLTTPVTYTHEATDQPWEMTVSHTYTQAAHYSWDTPGFKAVTMTAENCGGSQIDYHTVEVREAGELPDLAITSVWYDADENLVRFVIVNQGQSTAPAGHVVGLRKNGVHVNGLMINEPMESGAVRAEAISHYWDCAGETEGIELVADVWGDVPETNEGNNSWSDIWPCDREDPTFVGGPEVTATRETAVDLWWQTSEPTDCQVDYSTQAYIASTTAVDPVRAAIHNLTLKNLEPDTVYHAQVLCEDPAGNGVLSDDFLFETNPPNTDPPRFSDLRLLRVPGPFYDFYELRAELAPDQLARTSHVVFYMDKEPIGMDYWPDIPTRPGYNPYYSVYLSPYALGLSWNEFFATHAFDAEGVSASGVVGGLFSEDITPAEPSRRVDLEILWPSEHGSVYFDTLPVPAGQSIDVQVRAAQYEWGCTWSGFSESLPPGLDPVLCADVVREVNGLTAYIDTVQAGSATPTSDQVFLELNAGVSGLDVGPHTLRVVADTDDILPTELEQDFFLVQGDRSLDIQRTVTREDHYLRVTLTLLNNGDFVEGIGVLHDSMVGLQPLFEDNPALTGTVFDRSWEEMLAGLMEVKVQLNIDPPDEPFLWLAPGETYDVEYLAVPILHQSDVALAIGHHPVEMTVLQPSGFFEYVSYDRPATGVVDPVYGQVSLEQAVLNAAGEADYIIVTDPVWAKANYPGSTWDKISRLYRLMGQLAILKNGVLGTLDDYDTSSLDGLIEPGGAWAEAMHPDFQETDKGYVLIVGETEVVPAHYIGSDHFYLADELPVHDSDLWYADTSGQTSRPELVVGRVLGDGPGELADYLENILNAYNEVPGYGFDRSHAFIMSGGPPNASTFVGGANRAYAMWWPQTDDLPYLVHAREWTSATLLWQEVEPQLADRDMILYFGHGNVNTWNGTISSGMGSVAAFDLGDSTPVVLATTCLSGGYEQDTYDHGIAEEFLKQGAGVYMGATQISYNRANDAAFRRFAEYWNEWESAGEVLNHVKRAIWSKDGWYEPFSFWGFEQNLYGDPKFGRLEGVWQPPESDRSGIESADRSVAGLTKVSVAIPQPVIARVEGYYEATIPGGLTIVEFGAYEVPVWTASMAFPAGQVVQDVQLLNRDDPQALGGLSLSVVSTATSALEASRVAAAAAVSGWYPELEQDFEWSLETMPDGSTELEIVVYPFYYNSDNGDALYHQKYTFSVETVQTAVQIKAFSVKRDTYDLGQTVVMNLAVENGGEVADVVVQAAIRDRATGDLIAGLPLTALHDLDGMGALGLQWDSAGTPYGEYQAVVELRDTEGQLLDTAVDHFSLGIVSGEVTLLAADQVEYYGGESVQLSMTFANDGSVPITGVGRILVQGTEGLTTTYTITGPITSLAPGASITITGYLDTSVIDARYEVVANAYYFSQVSAPAELILSRKPRIYLPLAIKN